MDNLFETIEREFAELNPAVQAILLKLAPTIEDCIKTTFKRSKDLKIK